MAGVPLGDTYRGTLRGQCVAGVTSTYGTLTFWKRCWYVYVLEAMLACLGMFRFGPTWEEALCVFEKFEQNGLEAMLACFLRFRPGTILIRRGRHAHGCRHSVFVKTSLTVGF